nr:putative ribonuclease H-like domain-containing protein [Tanacetum cinerariifolium]
MVQKLVRNHAIWGNHYHYARMTHLNPQTHVLPTTVLTRSRIVLFSAAKPVNTVVPQTKVQHQRPATHVVNKAHSPIRRPINLRPSPQASNFHQKVTTAKAPQLPDENHVLLRVPKENNMYNVDLKDIVPSGDLTCKFDGKADDGFLVRYSISRSGPTWLFDINTLTKSMNYQPVIVGNQPNSSAGIQEYFDVDKAGEGNVQQYVLFPLWSSGSKDPQNTDADTTFEVKESEPEVHVSLSSSAKTKKHDDKTNKEAKGKIPAVGKNSTNNTNTLVLLVLLILLLVQHLGKSSYVDPSQYPDDPNMPALEDITYTDDEEDVSAEADISNLETNIIVSPIPTTRVHKDHHASQIIGDLSLAPLTRSFMVYQMDVKSAFLYETIKEEVYVCQPPGFEDPDYHDKVYKVVKELYGLHQAPRAWYETLANYLLENSFQKGKIDQTLFIKKQKGNILLVQVYVDDIIFGSTNKDLCKSFKKSMKDKFHMSSIGELTFFLGLQVKQKQYGIFISQDKYVAKILRKFGLSYGKSASTPIETKKPLLKDPNGDDTNDFVRLQALIDRRYVIITKDTVRQVLRLDDAESIDCLPIEEIFAELAMMGVGKGFSGVDTPLFEGMLVPQQVNDDATDDVANVVADAAEIGEKEKVDSFKIKEIEEDEDVTLEEVDAEVAKDVKVQGRLEESQAQVYHIDLEHANKVLSMHDDKAEPAKLKEIIKVVTTAKLMTKVVTAAATTITAAPIIAALSAARRRNGVVIRDPKAIATSSVIVNFDPKSKDKGKVILVEEPKPLKKQAQIEQDEAYAREKNMMVYLKNMAGFKMDFFKGMSYDDIRPIFKKHFKSIVGFLEKSEKKLEEEAIKAIKKKSETSKEKAAKKQKLDEEVEELKTHLQIVSNDEDDVYTEATPLALKVPIVDYQIHIKNNKPYYKIIRADGTHQLFLSCISLLRNFDREDMKMLWQMVQERFASSKPKNFSDDFFLNTLKPMFEKPNVE